MHLGGVSPCSRRTGRTFSVPPRFPLSGSSSPTCIPRTGLVLGAAQWCQASAAASMEGFQCCRQQRWSCCVGRIPWEREFVIWEGREVEGTVCRVLFTYLFPSDGVLHSTKDAWGSPACRARPNEDAFCLSHFVCSLNDAVNPQSHKTNPLLSSSWPC